MGRSRWKVLIASHCTVTIMLRRWSISMIPPRLAGHRLISANQKGSMNRLLLTPLMQTTHNHQQRRQSSCLAGLGSVAGTRGISAIVVGVILWCGGACRRESGVIVEEIVVPTGFHGWVEIAQDDPACPRLEMHGRRVVMRSDQRAVICLSNEIPETQWFKREYKFDDGSPVPRHMIHQEEGTGTTTYRNWVKHSASFCIGTDEECALKTRPQRLPPGPGWQEIGRDRRNPMIAP